VPNQFGLQLIFSMYIDTVTDPADHRCCTEAPPESVNVILKSDSISVSTDSPDHWLNFTAPFNSTVPTTFDAETTTTVAGIADVNNSFSGEVFQNGIQVDVVLGVDGELFGETLEYTLIIEPGTALIDILNSATVSQAPIEKVRSIGGSSSDASFESGASANDGAKTGTDFSSSDDVTIVGTINIDPDDQGQAGDIYVVLLSVNADGVVFSFLNEDGNYEAWDLPVPGLGAHISTDSLNEVYFVTVNTGTLQPGTYRVALAYSQGAKLVYAPKAIVVKTTD
jgi:hypothetical protein